MPPGHGHRPLEDIKLDLASLRPPADEHLVSLTDELYAHPETNGHTIAQLINSPNFPDHCVVKLCSDLLNNLNLCRGLTIDDYIGLYYKMVKQSDWWKRMLAEFHSYTLPAQWQEMKRILNQSESNRENHSFLAQAFGYLSIPENHPEAKAVVQFIRLHLLEDGILFKASPEALGGLLTAIELLVNHEGSGVSRAEADQNSLP